MPADFASQTPQFPLNAGGIFGQNGILSYGRFFVGSGGLPAPAAMIGPTGLATGIKNAGIAGWPGIGATLVGTGRYNIMHPPATIVSLDAKAATPSGVNLTVNEFRGVATGFAGAQPGPGGGLLGTGITQIQVFGPGGGSGTVREPQLVNAPTGTRFDLLLYTAPNNTQGLTQF